MHICCLMGLEVATESIERGSATCWCALGIELIILTHDQKNRIDVVERTIYFHIHGIPYHAIEVYEAERVDLLDIEGLV